MGNINLSEEEKQKLLQALNDENEPPAEIAQKLFPGLFTRLQDESRFDVKKLVRAKIPTIEYEGKRSEASILNSAAMFGGQSPLQVVRCFDEGRLNKNTDQLMLIKESGPTYEAGWRNLIVQGDNLQFLKTCYLNQDPLIRDKVKGKVKLIYIDPPFSTQSDFLTGVGETSYSDRVDRAEFIEALRERFVFMRELLAPEGHIFVHLDHRMNHYTRTVMDEVFAETNFRNEIMLPGRASKNLQQQFEQISRLNVRHDTLLWYSSTPSSKLSPLWIEKHNKGNPEGHWHHFWSTANRPTMRYALFGITPETGQWVWQEGRAQAAVENYERYLEERSGRTLAEYWRDTGSTLEFIRKDPNDGKPQYWRAPAEDRLADTVWAGIPVYDSSTKYPTEKNEKLLAQILDFASSPRDLVMDLFAGSGTTAAVAEKMSRRWIACDFGKHAIYIIQKRLIEIGDSPKPNVLTGRQAKVKYGEQSHPFCIATVGAYDFSKIMNLRENRDAYVNFVLEMFGISDRDGNYEKKYKLNDIYAEKDGDPVMVFPVWEDDYLKNVRIDEEYLKGLLDQTGGRLKGDVYIICPETCTTISDTEFKNARNQKVTFRLLTFPYKVLEEVSRNFQIEEQPSSQDNINNLVSSVGFYFNQEVKLKVKKLNGGFEIKEFDTAVTDREGNRFDGLDGLAMMLVDADYGGEVFKIDAAIYQKDIKNNKVTLKGLGPRSALIAIDKFGNESKIAVLK